MWASPLLALLSPVAAWGVECPVVADLEPTEWPEDAVDWLLPVGGRLVGHSDAGLRSWAPKDGAKPVVLVGDSSDAWPHWMWAPRGDDAVVNHHTGRVVRVADGRALAELPESERLEHDDVVGRGSGFLAWSGWSGRPLRVQRDEKMQTYAWTGDDDRVSAAAPATGDTIWAAADEEVARLAPDGTVRASFPGSPIAIEALAASPDGSSLAVVGYEGVVQLFDVQAEAARWSWPSSGRNGAAFSPKGRWLLVTGAGRGADLLDAKTGCLRAVLPTEGAPVWVDDSHVAWVGADGRLRVEAVP